MTSALRLLASASVLVQVQGFSASVSRGCAVGHARAVSPAMRMPWEPVEADADAEDGEAEEDEESTVGKLGKLPCCCIRAVVESVVTVFTPTSRVT